MSLLLCLLQVYVDVYVSPVLIHCVFFITIVSAGGLNMNGSYYMIIAVRAHTQVSENLHYKGRKVSSTLKLDLEGLI